MSQRNLSFLVWVAINLMGACSGFAEQTPGHEVEVPAPPSGTTHASAIPVPTALSAEEKKVVVDVLLCARTLIGEQRGESHGILPAAFYLTQARRGAAGGSGFSTLGKRCWEQLKLLPRSWGTRAHQYEMAHQIMPIGTPRSVRELILDFAKPYIDCTKGSANLDVALVVGPGAKVGAGKCTSSDGRSWIELSPAVSLNFGIGAALTGAYGSSHRAGKVSRFPVDYSIRTHDAGGLVWAYSSENESEGRLFSRRGDEGEEGSGVGLGLLAGFRFQPEITIIPLGTDTANLVSRLQKE